MATIEDFILRFKTVGSESIKAAQNGLQGLKDDVANFGQVSGPLSNTVNGIIGKLGPIGVVASAAAAGFGALALSAINMADALADISDATGVSAGALSNLKNSLILAGGKAEDFASIASKLNKNVGEAASGNEGLQKTFQTLGVYVTDSNGKLRDTGSILQDAIAKLSGIEDPAIRAKLAVELFGKEASKLDFTKLNAVNDPFKDAQIAQLAKYRDAIDSIANSASNSLLKVFGELAIEINKAYSAADEVQKKLEDRGRTGLISPGVRGTIGSLLGITPKEPLITREMTDQEKAAKAKREFEASQSLLMRPYKSRAQTGEGGYGATPEATLKAAADSRQRIAQSEAEVRKQRELSTSNQISAIEINAKYEAVKAKADIDNKERLSNAQKSAEYAAKEKEIFSKRDNDIAKARRDLNVRIFTEEMAQAEQNAKDLAAYYQQVDQARLQAFDQVQSIKQAREELGRRVALEEQIITLSDRQTKNAIDLLSLEEERLKAVRAISQIQNLPYTERLEREKAVNEEYDKSKQLIIDRQNIEFSASRSFSKGWEKALAEYTDNSQNSFQQASKLFQTVTGGMEDAIVNFAKTGKFEFKGFLSSIVEELLRSEVRSLISQLFGLRTGGGGGGGLFGGKIIPGFLADGGPAMAGKPYIVGERGPELFIPGASGAVIPNEALGGGNTTNVIYNISAVDTNSFKQLVARDPSFIYAVTEQGRKNIPQVRR